MVGVGFSEARLPAAGLCRLLCCCKAQRKWISEEWESDFVLRRHRSIVTFFHAVLHCCLEVPVKSSAREEGGKWVERHWRKKRGSTEDLKRPSRGTLRYGASRDFRLVEHLPLLYTPASRRTKNILRSTTDLVDRLVYYDPSNSDRDGTHKDRGDAYVQNSVVAHCAWLPVWLLWAGGRRHFSSSHGARASGKLGKLTEHAHPVHVASLLAVTTSR